MRKIIRKYTPYALKIRWQLTKRYWQDKQTKIHHQFALKGTPHPEASHKLSLQQPIKKSYLYENKVHNLKLGSQKINQVVLQPQQILSFWKTLQAPTAQNGYKKGRNIVNGVLSEDIGGGLCQLSGILYHLALLGGLTVLERHHHSLDIYTEEARYSPLGGDATVVYGYKDLRIQNPFDFPIYFDFDIDASRIIAYLHSPSPIPLQQLNFRRDYQDNTCHVHCLNQAGQVVGESIYTIPS